MKNKEQGFTLIELLATLTVMAIIAAVLFPFIGNYVSDASKKTNIRSLKIMQDAIDRYRLLSTNRVTGWGTPAVSGNTLLTGAQAEQILSDITSPGANQTMRPKSPSLTSNNVWMMVTEGDTSIANWEVLAYRENTNSDGVNRVGTVYSSGNWNNATNNWGTE